MKNLLTYNEFLNEDYRDVAGCGSGGIHSGDNLTGVNVMGGNTTLTKLGDISGGDQKVIGTEVIKLSDPYFGQRRKRTGKTPEIEQEKKKQMRRKIYKKLLNLDKETLEENFNNVNYIDWCDLLEGEKTDIVEHIYGKSNYLQQNWNIWTFKDNLDNEINFKIPIIQLDVKQAKEYVDEHWGLSEINLKEVRKYKKLNPVLSDNGEFSDGGHRITVAYERGMKTIDAYEISHLLNWDWEKFDNGESLPEFKN